MTTGKLFLPFPPIKASAGSFPPLPKEFFTISADFTQSKHLAEQQGTASGNRKARAKGSAMYHISVRDGVEEVQNTAGNTLLLDAASSAVLASFSYVIFFLATRNRHLELQILK